MTAQAPRFILITRDAMLATTPEGDVVVDKLKPPAVTIRLSEAEDLYAARIDADDAAAHGLHLQPARYFLDDRRVARAVALLDHRERFIYGPMTGEKLVFDEDGILARDGNQTLFPRVDPAVIGLIRLAGTDVILMGRKRGNEYFSFVAGFVEAGENLEEAFAREVKEETGRIVSSINYWGSQPWPVGGSLMVAFCAETHDRHPRFPTDGELAEVRWVDPQGLKNLPIAPPGSIARQMIDWWLAHYDETNRNE